MIKYIALIVILVWCFCWSMLYMNRNIVVAYDCRAAEISPDYPLTVKQKCREMLRGFAE